MQQCDYNCAYRQQFYMLLRPCSNVLCTIMSVFNMVPPEGHRHSMLVFDLAPYIQISLDSLNFLMIIWIVDAEIPCTFMLRNVVLKLLDYLSMQFFTSVESCLILACDP